MIEARSIDVLHFFCLMNNKEISLLLRKVAAAYALLNENRFKIVAYENAASSIEHLTEEATGLWKQGKLDLIPGVGKSLASHLDELFSKGKVQHFEAVLNKIPASVFPLLEIPGFGPKKAYNLVNKLKLQDPNTVVDELLTSARNGKIKPLEGFGEKSEHDIVRALEAFKGGRVKNNRMLLPYAKTIADEIMQYLSPEPYIIAVETLGSLRRSVSTIGDVDLAIATTEPQKAVEYFLRYPKIKEVVEQGKGGTTVLLGGNQQVDLRIIAPDSWGSMLQYFTGSKQHNIHLRELALKKGLSLNEYGIKDIKSGKLAKFSSEQNFYHYLGMEWIPPELREDQGEIEAASKGNLPDLVSLDDIKGDLQIHSSFPIEPSHDLGKNSMNEILDKAKEKKYQYIAFTEHNPSILNHTKNEIMIIMKERKEKIEQLKYSYKNVRILNLLEIDILANGELALPHEAFQYIDGCLASIHSSFMKPSEEMTARVLKGLTHPKVRIFAHPTGRLLNKREGINIDFMKVFGYCRDHNIALEINAYPDRLDLPDMLVKNATTLKVKFSIGTDAHDVIGMDMMPYGVSVARRGWLEASDILNTMDYNTIRNWLFNPQ